ncbi:MAG: N-acetylmuramoyl-L-alanine amidase [Rhodospirillaceae bacterium]|nr:MAG: N-acetylmuramoyl-L-alanine amidase [Rhodospirillaceae bacterium]
MNIANIAGLSLFHNRLIDLYWTRKFVKFNDYTCIMSRNPDFRGVLQDWSFPKLMLLRSKIQKFTGFLGLVMCAGVVFFGLIGESVAQTPLISEVRVGLHGERTRVVLELDSSVKFDVFTLPEPYRVVLNLPEVRWNIDAQGLPENKGVLDGMRYGLFTPGTSRMVFDVKGPVNVHKVFLLKPLDGKRWRLVMDLSPTSETEFLEALAAKRAKDRKDLAALVASATKDVTVPATTNATSAQQNAYVPPVPPRKPTVPGKRIIAIDPGHGGIDPGTIGVGNTYEKNITLALGLELKRSLEATGRYKVVMTRSRDIFHRLRDRVSIARKAGAELFISVHADSMPNKRTRGLSIYTLSEKASDKEAAKLAAKENKSDLIAGIDLSTESKDVTNILLDLAQRETMNQSAKVAENIVSELRREIKLLRNPHRYAGFAVLKAPDMPSVLLEAGFLSNRQDQKNLLSKKYRKSLSQAITRGVDRHFKGVEQAYNQ